MRKTLCMIILLGVVACVHRPRSEQAQDEQALGDRQTTQALRDFVAQQADGKSLQGKVILIDVWASWCSTCEKALPFYHALEQEFSTRGLVVLSVNVDEDDEAAARVLAKLAPSLRAVRDPRGMWPERFAVEAMPTAFLLDQSHELRARYTGFNAVQQETIRRDVEHALNRYVSFTKRAMSTEFSIELLSQSRTADDAAVRACFALIEHVEQTMNEWQPSSPLSKLNELAGKEPVTLPRDLIEVLSVAQDIAKRSTGAFDVTWAALWGLWRFDGSRSHVPAKSDIAAKLPLVNWRELWVDPGTRRAWLKRAGMKVGLGGIAKGYTLDLLRDELRRRGYDSFLISSGGQIYAAGTKEGKPWRIGIQDPRGPRGQWIARIAVSDMSVSTSGDYERFFFKDGVRYHHIIDLKTGMPARGSQSSTVVSRSNIRADGFTKAVFTMERRRALALAQREGFDMLTIAADGKVIQSQGFADLLVSN